MFNIGLLTAQHKQSFVKVANALFYFALVLYWSLSIVWTSTAMGILTSLGYIIGIAAVMALLVLREAICCLAIRRYDFRDVIGLLILALFAYIANRNESATVAAGYLLIFAARDMDYKKIFRYAIATTIVGIFVIYYASMQGFITYGTWMEGTTARHAFGFIYPLVIPAYLLNIGMMTFAVREEKIAWWQIAVLLIFTVLTYRWCKADLSSGLMVVLLVAMLVVRAYPEIINSEHPFWRYTDRLAVWFFPIAILISVVLAHFYNSDKSWMQLLDEITRDRLSLPHAALQNYGVKLWGQQMWFVGAGLDNFGNEVSGAYDYVDNVYINMLIRYGIVFVVISVILMVLTMEYCRLRHMRIILWLFCLMAVHGLLEDKMQTVYFNSLLLLVGQAVQRYHGTKKHTQKLHME